MTIVHEYDDIPGTTVFDAERSRQGYHLNMFCMSLMKPENRDAFRDDEERYLDAFPMSVEQRKAVLDALELLGCDLHDEQCQASWRILQLVLTGPNLDQ